MLAFTVTMPATIESRSQVRAGTALVTSTRLILLDHDGGTSSLNYGDIQRLEVRGGTKKLFGGYNKASLWITSGSGDSEEWSLGDGGDWGLRVAQAAQQAHENFLLSH